MKKKIRPLGQITSDLEKLLFELHIDHDLQHGEVLYLINGWQRIHVPSQIETYTKDQTNPTLHPSIYGPNIVRPNKKAKAQKR